MSKRREVLKYFKEQKEYMDKRVSEGIEKYRKGGIKINVVDKNGNPVKNAKIKAELTNHEFNFGANIFMLDTLIDYKNNTYEEGLFAKDFNIDEMDNYKQRNEKYKELFKEMFNFATLPFYWKENEPTADTHRYEKDEPHIHRRPAPRDCVNFCKANGIRMKAHCLNYRGIEPQWVRDLETAEQVKEVTSRRFKNCADRFAEDIPGWEVTNEMLVQQHLKVTKFAYDKNFIEWSFKEARKHFPNNELIINDNHETCWENFMGYNSAYYMQIEKELAKGTPIDTIGLQFHVFYQREKELEMAAKFYNPEWLYEVMDIYAEFGKPLQITEITVPAYSNEPEDEEIQAEIIKNLYKIWFSHPNMEAIVYWNIPEGYLGPVAAMDKGENYYHGGFTRFDFSKKPSWYALYDLLHNEWQTKEELEAKDGNASFRGFYGDYKIDVTVNDKTVTQNIFASKKADNIFTITINE